MHRQRKLLPLILLAAAILAAAGFLFLKGANVAVLNPKGSIAHDQFNLIVFTSALSLIIIIPVFTLTFYIAWKYRAGNKKAKYTPEWDRSRTVEIIWWLVPLALISVLAVVTWASAHRLDPFRPISSAKKPLTVQVVALQWKWLFMYPEQHIATVNYVRFPENTPINFEITSDAPMNSFWIPQLGGQVYAMAGMKTQLHLQATQTGEYRGSSANISGEGFAGMTFTAKAMSDADFDAWLAEARMSDKSLTTDTYNSLAEPSKNNAAETFAGVEENLYDTIITKYTTPGISQETTPRSMHTDSEMGH